MYRSQYPWVELWKALHDYEGSDVYADLLEPWPDAHPGEIAWLAEMAATSPWDPSETGNEDLCRLYSASRVTTVLMLRFQQGRADGNDWPGPAISLEGFQRFHEALGLRVPGATRFHPFFHEVVRVEQVEPAERPIELIRQVWPPLMLGDMMFSRGGCHVAGGSDHIVKDVAEHSILYWAERRKHRLCEDQSYGWGTNSQWRTLLRRDYQTSTGYSYNVDGAESLNEASGVVEGVETATWVELVRHRCVIRAELTAPDPYPYCYAYEEDG